MTDAAWRMKGQYIKNCNCIATCPCDTIGFPYPEKGCEGMAGMHIVEGNFGDVKLDGLTWAVTYHWPGALSRGQRLGAAIHRQEGNRSAENRVADSAQRKGGECLV